MSDTDRLIGACYIEKLEEIQERILETAKDLKTSRWQPKSLQSILTKKQLIKEDFKTFEKIIEKYEYRVPTVQWNQLTDKLTLVKTKYDFCIKALNHHPIHKEKIHNLRHRTITVYEGQNTTQESALDRSFSETDLTEDKESDLFSSTFNSQTEDVDNVFTIPKFAKIDLHDVESKAKITGRKVTQTKATMALNMQLAIQCIPEYHGSVDELEPFLVQIKFFAKTHPDDVSQKQLLNIVLMKLKGKAATFINRIKSETWDEMLKKLRSTFSKIVSSEEILQQIVGLEQGFKESFIDYTDRALRIQECLEQLEEQPEQPQQQQHKATFSEKSLRIHFIGGLRNGNLKQVAKAQKVQTFKELIQILELEHKECEQLEVIEQRLQTCRIGRNQQSNNNMQNRNYNNSYNEGNFKNRNSNNNRNSNFNNNRNFNQNTNQNRQQNSGGYQNRSFNNKPMNSGGYQNRGNFAPPQESRRDYTQNQQNNNQNQGSSNWRQFNNMGPRNNFNQRKN